MVATRRRTHLLGTLVDKVLSDPGALELIVVVDGTDDLESPALLTQLGRTTTRLRHLVTDRLGQMGALAAGVDAARGELVLLLDDDVLPQCALATGHSAHHAGRRGLVVVGAMPVDAGGDVEMPATESSSTRRPTSAIAANWCAATSACSTPCGSATSRCGELTAARWAW